MWKRKLLSSLTLVTLLGACAGCSLFSSNRVPDDHPIRQDVDCSGWLPPTIDLGLGLAFATGGVLFFTEVIDEGETWKLAGGVSGAVAGAFLLASAIAGYVWTAECKACEELHVQWRMEANEDERRKIELEWYRSRGLPEERRPSDDR